MTRRSRTSTLLVTALSAGALVAAGSAHGAGATAEPRVNLGLTVLSRTGIYPSVVTTDRGVTLAKWTLDSRPKGSEKPRTKLMWAVQRPLRRWSRRQVMGNWRVSPYTHGRPHLATSSGHRVTATWLDRRRRVVVEDWSLTHGWSRPTRLSDLAHLARGVRIASNDSGRVAVSWSQLSKGHPDHPVPAMVGVRRDGEWLVRPAGEVSPDIHSVGLPILVGIDADGAVTAAWTHLVHGRGPALVTRMPADGTSFETPTVFAESYGLGLAVQPEGGAMVNPGSSTGDVFTRVDDGDWTDAGVLPFGSESLTTPSGALVTWNTSGGVNVDPDGIAGPQPLASIGYPDLPRRAYSIDLFVTADSSLVAVARTPHQLLYAVRPDGGDWSAPVAAYRTTRNIRLIWSDSISASAQVTALLGTRAPRSRVHSSLRLDAVTFDVG